MGQLNIMRNVIGAGNSRGLFGEILNDSFDRASIGSSYSAVGAATWGANGTDLTVTDGHTTWADRLEYNYVQCFEEWELECQLILTSAVGASSYGIGIGHEDTQLNWNYQGFFNMSNDVNSGKARVFRSNAVNSATVLATSVGTVTPVQNETYTLRFAKRKAANLTTYTVTITRVSDASTASATWTETPGVITGPFANATGKFALWAFGGSVTVKYFKINVYDPRNVNVALISHSIGHGLCSTNLLTRYIGQLGLTSYAVSGGTGDQLTSVIGKAQNLLDYNANEYWIDLGTNDVAASVAVGTIMTRMQSVINPLLAAGKTVRILKQIPRNGQAIATLNSNIDSTFPTLQRIDLYTPLSSGANLAAAYNIGDNIHPNQAGHDLMAQTILAALAA